MGDGATKVTGRVFIDDCIHWLTETGYPADEGYDVIYIDPPYDTGARFSYRDSRVDWPEWMGACLSAARGRLRDDGAIFISIDDNRLIELCVAGDRVFGKGNRLAIMVTHQAQRSNAKHVNVVHEYVVAYAKDRASLPALSVPRRLTPDGEVIRSLDALVRREMRRGGRGQAQAALRRRVRDLARDGARWVANYRFVDDGGRIFYAKDLSMPGEPNEVDVPEIGLHLDPLPTRRWSTSQRLRELHDAGLLEFLDGRPYERLYLDDSRAALSSLLPFYSRQGTEELKRIGCGGLFDTPKPPQMVETLILAVASGRGRTRVLDFFGGSGTTAQATWQAAGRLGDGHELSFDLVQIDEAMREGTRPHATALGMGLEPTIPTALVRRLDAYVAASGRDDLSYEVIRVGGGDGHDAGGAGGEQGA